MFGPRKSTPMEILLVEDGLTDAKMTIFAIRRSGVHHRLSLVRTVADARRFLNREGVFSLAPPVNLLLLDMMLPDGSGLDLLHDLPGYPDDPDATATPSPNDITTVVLTASDQPNLDAECRRAGASDFMRKPVKEDDFMRIVRDHKRWMIDTEAPDIPLAPPPTPTRQPAAAAGPN